MCGEDRERQIKLEESKNLQERRWSRLKQICPPAYLKINRSMLPIPSKLDDVMAWKIGAQGLLLHGGTGQGKSRCAWALLAREHMDGVSIAAIDSMAGVRYAANYSISPTYVCEWMEELIAVKILLMDDIFKNKLTDSFEGAVFTIIDQRAQSLRPTIVTCNDSGTSLVSRMSEDRGEPLLRRLREHCMIIKF